MPRRFTRAPRDCAPPPRTRGEIGTADATPQRLGRPARAKGGWPRGWYREGDGRDQVASCVFKHERDEVTATTRAARRRIADGGYKRARCYENRRMRESEWRCCCELSKVSFVTSVFEVQIGVARVCVSRACASRALARDGRAGWCRTLRSGRARRCPRARRAAPRARPAGGTVPTIPDPPGKRATTSVARSPPRRPAPPSTTSTRASRVSPGASTPPSALWKPSTPDSPRPSAREPPSNRAANARSPTRRVQTWRATARRRASRAIPRMDRRASSTR